MRRRWIHMATPRRLLTVVGLTLAWCALWGEISWANVLSGAIVGSVALSVGVGGSGRGGVRIGALMRLVAAVSVDLVVSTFTVAREVLTPTDHTAEGIIAVPISAPAKHHLLLLFVAITVTPGTAVVAAEADGSVLYLHVLHRDRREAVEQHVRRLAELACTALPTVDDRVEVMS